MLYARRDRSFEERVRRLRAEEDRHRRVEAERSSEEHQEEKPLTAKLKEMVGAIR